MIRATRVETHGEVGIDMVTGPLAVDQRYSVDCKTCGEFATCLTLEGARAEVESHNGDGGDSGHHVYCELPACGNELTFEDIQAGDGLCSHCAEGDGHQSTEARA